MHNTQGFPPDSRPFPPDKKASPDFGEAFSVPKAGLEPARLLKDIGF